jgi:hypothetical protein
MRVRVGKTQVLAYSRFRKFSNTGPIALNEGSGALRARGRFNGFCDDEIVPLICPTCQASAQIVHSGDRRLLCMGLFSIFFSGSRDGPA